MSSDPHSHHHHSSHHSASSSSSHEHHRHLGDSGTQVVDRLFLGDKKLAANLDALQALGITHVVNATMDIRNYFEKEHEQHQQITYLRCPCHDTDVADLSEHFEPSFTFIHEAIQSGHAVLVHCQQGISRSATIAISYLIKSRGMSVASAYTLVRSKRPVVRPKANFLRQLMKWEKDLTGKTGDKKNSSAADKISPTAEEALKASAPASEQPELALAIQHANHEDEPAKVLDVAPGLNMILPSSQQAKLPPAPGGEPHHSHHHHHSSEAKEHHHSSSHPHDPHSHQSHRHHHHHRHAENAPMSTDAAATSDATSSSSSQHKRRHSIPNNEAAAGLADIDPHAAKSNTSHAPPGATSSSSSSSQSLSAPASAPKRQKVDATPSASPPAIAALGLYGDDDDEE